MAKRQETQKSKSGENQVLRVLKQAVYFHFFSGPDPEHPEVDYLLLPFLPQTVYKSLNWEIGRELRIVTGPPSADAGFRIREIIADQVISKTFFRMEGVHNNFEPNFQKGTPGSTPPPSLFFPLSRKLTLEPETYAFLDGQGSDVHCVGVARFYPITGATVFIGGVGDIIEGHGQLQGTVGTLTVNGYSRQPPTFSNDFVFRLVDPTGKFTSASPLPRIESEFPDPFPESVPLSLMAELHPDYPVGIEPTSDGKKQQVRLIERIRLADITFDVGPSLIRSHSHEGEVVGERRTTLIFDPADPNQVIPLFSAESEFTFFASGNKKIGTLKVEISEGRAFRTTSPELEQPYFRIAGYGTFLQGTGQFREVTGLMSVNGALSLTPAALSSMYVLRVYDPFYRFRSLQP